MKADFLGDSYDIVKRFFVHELKAKKYSVLVHAGSVMNSMSQTQRETFLRFLGAKAKSTPKTARPSALFFDPDTGIREKPGKSHSTFSELCEAADSHEFVFAFDQAFSRVSRKERQAAIRRKLEVFKSKRCHAMYYNSHACFVFVSCNKKRLREWESHLIALGLPESRLIFS